jgi:hypothetical protein
LSLPVVFSPKQASLMKCVQSLVRTSPRMGRLALAVFAANAVVISAAHAQWTITTYLHPVGNSPITSMRLADQYFSGAKPQRFTGTSAVAMVDLWEGPGSSGLFPINNPFPGLDKVPGPNHT